MDLRDLYQDVILDHNKRPRNFGPLDDANCEAHGYNPLCGDDYTVRLRVEDGIVHDIKFDGEGCAISKAAASMMTARIKGGSVADAQLLAGEFRKLLTGTTDSESDAILAHLRVFAGVSQLPNRIKCAVLPWHTLVAALEGSQVATTEGEADPWSSNS